MQSDDSVAQLVEKIKAGDEEASRALWNRYFPQLVRVAQQKLVGRGTRMADGEDVALSALRSFFRAAADDRFPDLLDRDGLWRLLSVMTYRKAVDLIRHEDRQKRRVLGESVILEDGSGSQGCPMDQLPGPDPTPELAAELAEACERRLGLLNADLQAIAIWKLEGRTNREIAERCGCSVPTVERSLHLIRKKWKLEKPS